MPDVPAPYRHVLDQHRDRLKRVADRGGVARLKRVYEDAIGDLERKLTRLPGRKGSTFTAHQYRLYLGQLRQGLAVLTKRMAEGLGDISKDAQTEALRGLITDVTRLERTFTGAEVVLPVEDVGRFRGVIGGVRESMLRSQATSAARYGAHLISKMEDQLGLSLATGEDLGSTIDRIMNTAGTEWWKAERVARTELIWSFNATHHSGLKETARELPDMMMRWSEHISDTTGRALDDRVDGGRIEDSHAMHGQVVPVGGVFKFPSTMPNGGPIPRTLHRFSGKSWAHPPNRPNDRAVLAPYRPHWGIPGWQLLGGQRVKL